MKPTVSKHKHGVFLKSRLDEANLKLLARYKDAKHLTIEGVKAESLDFLLEWKQLEDIRMYNCYFKDCSALTGLKKFRKLFINGIREKAVDLTYLSELHWLEELGIGYVPNLVKLPDLSKCKRLKRVDFFNLKRLGDLTEILQLPNLESFGIVCTRHEPSDLEPIMAMPKLKTMSGAFGSRKKDACFKELLAKHDLQYG